MYLIYIVTMIEPTFHKYHRASIIIPEEDDYTLLATKVFNRFSQTQWRASRIAGNLPIKKNILTSLRHSLLSSFSALPLHTECGAYINFNAHFENVVNLYKEQEAFILPDTEIKIWNWKLSWDNVKIWKETEAWTLSPVDVLYSQQPIHAHLIMYAEIPERNIPMGRCVTESRMQDFLHDLNNSSTTYHGTEIFHNSILDADWIGLCRALDTSLPNNRNLYTPICFRCGINKEYLRLLYYDNPFQWFGDVLVTTDFPNAIFDEIPLSSYRYD